MPLPPLPLLPSARGAPTAAWDFDAAGTPNTNTTFFCESKSGNCFLLRTATLGFYDAADTCAAFTGGNLVTYTSRSKQMLVRCYGGRLWEGIIDGQPRWQLEPENCPLRPFL
jgi:hypothetical protein